ADLVVGHPAMGDQRNIDRSCGDGAVGDALDEGTVEEVAQHSGYRRGRAAHLEIGRDPVELGLITRDQDELGRLFGQPQSAAMLGDGRGRADDDYFHATSFQLPIRRRDMAELMPESRCLANAARLGVVASYKARGMRASLAA